jgi:hypothetical protein
MIYQIIDIAFDVINSKTKTCLSFPGVGTIQDIVRFGFSFVESEDHFVAYVLAHPDQMKQVLCGFPDAILDPDKESIGRLCTAKLITTKKLKKNQVGFSNGDLSVVLILDMPL